MNIRYLEDNELPILNYLNDINILYFVRGPVIEIVGATDSIFLIMRGFTTCH